MTTNIDCFTKIGKSHDDCQDYSEFIHTESSTCILVSDGCSGAPYTDWGSRLLVRAMRKVIPFYTLHGEYNFEHIKDKIKEMFLGAAKTADEQRYMLNLPAECLRATLLTCFLKPFNINSFVPAIWGDGTIIAKSKSDELHVFQREFSSNAPYYLQYELYPEHKKGYFQSFEGTQVIQKHWIQKGKEVIFQESTSTPLLPEVNAFEVYNFPLHDYDLVAVFSDGVSSFIQKVFSATNITNENIDVVAILDKLLPFKGYQGPFVKRRCKRFFEECNKAGMFNHDDFSLGVIHHE